MNWGIYTLEGLLYVGLNYNLVIDWIRRIYAIATAIHIRWQGLLTTRHSSLDTTRVTTAYVMLRMSGMCVCAQRHEVYVENYYVSGFFFVFFLVRVGVGVGVC